MILFDSYIFSRKEIALAYAKSAERLFGSDDGFLTVNPGAVPIFVNLLFQSLEISIKYAGIESRLFTIEEVRQKRIGHRIGELAELAMERLGGNTSDLIMAMTCCNNQKLRSDYIIEQMIYGGELQETRECYCTRGLGYGEVYQGGLRLINSISEWIESVKQTAANLPLTVDVITQWKGSTATSTHFGIWFVNDQ
jgi:hypothetical protein